MPLEGTDLRRFMRSRGILEVDRAVEIAHGVAIELGALHQRGITYGNLQPQDILIARSDLHIELSDMDNGSQPQYQAPEQFTGGTVTPATDIYALGIVTYVMLTGHVPFDGGTDLEIMVPHIQEAPTPPSQINPRITPELEAIILKCLEKRPEDRWQDGLQLARALETLS